MRALLLLMLLATPAVHAHALRTVSVSLDELSPGLARVTVRLSAPDPSLRVRFPEGCVHTDETLEPGGEQAFTLRCPEPLAGGTLAVEGLGPVLGEAVFYLTLHDGRSLSHLMLADSARWRIPPATSTGEVARQYVALGVEHILTGADHLLFLVLLVLVLRRPRAVLVAETAFTLSHSLTLSATALGWLRVSAPWAEACIAFSLVLMALDVQRPDAPPVSVGRGASAALLFGLVHGLGFAGGLKEVGVPEQAVLPALAGFGVGVELGQVAFLAGVLGVVWGASRLRCWPWLTLAGGYAAGSVGSYWLIERVWLCLAR